MNGSTVLKTTEAEWIRLERMFAKEWESPKAWSLYAQRFGIHRRAAARMRERFLKKQLRIHLVYWTLKRNSIIAYWIKKILEEIATIRSKRDPKVVLSRRNKITDEMVEAAKVYDVRDLVDFDRMGKAIAWCHNDNRPSLFYGDKTKKAICPVCNKKFNAVDVLMTRDGYTFLDAVRSLQ